MDSDASARTPVADEDTVSGLQVGIVIVGISITLPLLYSAGELARGVGLAKAIVAVVAGALILSLMSVPAAVVGARTRLSSYMIIEHTFGFAGAKFVNFWFGLFLLGWYAVTAELFGRTLLGQGGGIMVAYVLGMIPVLVWDELEPMSYMLVMGFGAFALAVLVFATWTTNVVNLYSTALAARASVPLGNYRSVVIVSGIVGTIAALGGIADHLIDFLITLGLLVPPIAGVYLCDFFILGRTDFSAVRLEQRPAIRINAVTAGVGSGLAATWMYYAELSLTSIGSLDSLLISIAVYLALEKGTALVAPQ